MGLAASRVVFSCRKEIANAFQTEPETVLFTSNTTDGINKAFYGLLRHGDHVLISDLEHNSVLRPLIAMRDRGIITFDVIATGNSDEETLENFRQGLTSNPNLVFCTNASNVTGRILPVQSIGELCRSNGILFGVDGAQTAGTLEYDLKNEPIDFVCVPGHKGLLGPQGTGALILAKPLEIHPVFQGGTGSDSLSEEQPKTFPEGFESGTLNTPGIAGLREGVRFAQRNLKSIRNHEKALRELFLTEISKIPFYRAVGTGDRFAGVVSLIHENAHSEQISLWLNHCNICVRGGYHCSALAHKTLGTTGCGAVRISFGYANSEKDVYECVKSLKKYQNY